MTRISLRGHGLLPVRYLMGVCGTGAHVQPRPRGARTGVPVGRITRTSTDSAGASRPRLGFRGRDDPGEDERLLAPGVVTAAAATVAGFHLGLEQERAAAGGSAQPGDPLGRLVVQHPGVIEAGEGEDRKSTRL